MRKSSKIIFFEVNEIPWTIINRYIYRNPQSALARIVRGGVNYRCAYDETISDLSPWRTWPTVHRGVRESLHKIRDLGQVRPSAIDQPYPPIWQTLLDEGKSVGIFGSLHSATTCKKQLSSYAFYVPDTFSDSYFSNPSDLEALLRLNHLMVQESKLNVSRNLPFKQLPRAILSLFKNNISPSALWQVLEQLCVEFIKKERKVRRRSLQSILFFDLYFSLLKSTRPDFSTFFTNHVASTLHRYWAATFPDDVVNGRVEEKWGQMYRDEVWFVMNILDKFLERLLRFMKVDTRYELWIVSSMGQAPTDFKKLRSQIELVNPDNFLKFLGISESVEPVSAMFPQYNFKFKNSSLSFVRLSQNLLNSLTINGEKLSFRFKEPDFLSIDLGQPCNNADIAVEYNGRFVDLSDLGLSLREVEGGVASTSYHVPDGVFIRYSFDESVLQRRFPNIGSATVFDIAPSVMDFFGLKPRPYMLGASLV